VKAVLYNRILLFLGFVGLFVAGVLSLAHFWNVIPPCGASSECDKVTSDPSSMWGGIYVGYVGLLGYILLTALALARAYGSPSLFRPLALVGYVVAVGGTLISIGLQCYSIFQIHALCKWCLSSAITMTVTLIVYALLYQEASETPPPTEDGKIELAGDGVVAAPTSIPRVRSRNTDFFLATGLVACLLVAMVAMGNVLKHQDQVTGIKLTNLPPNFDLIPSNHPNVYGDMTAPVTIVEFADLNCPACKANGPLIKDFVSQHPGKIRLMYRHLPLPMHKTSAIAAFIDDYAAEKGKFWDYTEALMSQKEEVDDPEVLFQVATSLGLDEKDIKKRMADDKDPIYQRLTDDENAAGLIGVSSTPTFIVLATGLKPNAYGPSALRDALREPPYSSIIDGK
jgi:protein-disulfide isomerase/uncharacterized membrane protein